MLSVAIPNFPEQQPFSLEIIKTSSFMKMMTRHIAKSSTHHR